MQSGRGVVNNILKDRFVELKREKSSGSTSRDAVIAQIFIEELNYRFARVVVKDCSTADRRDQVVDSGATVGADGTTIVG